LLFPFGRKYKAVLTMARRELPPQLLQEIRDLAQAWGKIVARRAFGEEGPGLDTDFHAMEQIAQAAANGLAEGALATLLEQQAQTLGQQLPCPECGTLCAMTREPRTLHRPGGTVTPNEPVGHCPACRRDFFPPTAAAAPR
jgi:hypothetical protein